MGKPVTLEIPEHIYRTAERSARATGQSVEDVLITAIKASIGLPVEPQSAAPSSTQKPIYTKKQGQYLAFIHHYTKLHGRPPAEADMGRFFRTSPPTVHQMVIRLEERGFISRVPGQPRTIQVLVSPDQLPELKGKERKR